MLVCFVSADVLWSPSIGAGESSETAEVTRIGEWSGACSSKSLLPCRKLRRYFHLKSISLIVKIIKRADARNLK